jgi:trehalose 6-phosphate phosphatase
MKHVFSNAGLARFEALRGVPTLFAFDFDGTLAPIVASKSTAKLRPETEALLEELRRRAPVATITGRALRKIRSLIRVKLHGWAGDHGADVHPPRFNDRTRHRSGRTLVRAWTRELEISLASVPGVWTEVKALSLCVHFREAPNRAAALKKILKAVANLDPPPRALTGKCVVNLLNPLLPHKGDALKALMKGLGVKKAVYVGDDSNDEDVFALHDPRILTVRVGKLASSDAAFYLRGQAEIDTLLRLLLSLTPEKRYGKQREKAR